MICMRVRLQTVAYPGEGPTMHQGGGHDIGAKVDQEVVVDQRGGSLPQTRAAERPCPIAVLALAEGFGICIHGRGSEERDLHLCQLS